MNLTDARVLLTGASGGIGWAVARELRERGADILLTGRDLKALQSLAREIDPQGYSTLVIPADVASHAERRGLIDAASSWNGGVNVLINNAGIADFGLFEERGSETIERTFAVNALAPLQLCLGLLPTLKRQKRAHIVNMGSVFGAIAYPGHAVYSATKFALRGFSEALRRELADTSVKVHYLAPRATHTDFNSPKVQALNERFHVATDPPERVALRLCSMLERERDEEVIGWPEKLFVRVNALLPRLVDGALVKQTRALRAPVTLRADACPSRQIQEKTP
jgi:short-subunit dehydrogenase